MNIFRKKQVTKQYNQFEMDIQTQIDNYIASLPEQKGQEMAQLHQFIVRLLPGEKLWFLDGKNEDNKTVSNPSIGYGEYTISYANGTTKEFYRIGLSANSSGISVYLFGLSDKLYLSKTYGDKIGKATVTGYCIKFKTTNDIHLEVLQTIIEDVCISSK